DWSGHRCVGTNGMCKIEPMLEGNSFLKIESNKLVFIVYRDKLTLREEITILGKEIAEEGEDIFLMPESFPLNREISNALGIKEDASIIAGECPMIITKDVIEITFEIEMK
ncbi:hypothetical protein, partial [Winogradskyella sp.]|uniref:hypothetical protein n=1 Tax=Winogradskyella sp. TaxID=1883156 RepID=UPI0025D18208